MLVTIDQPSETTVEIRITAGKDNQYGNKTFPIGLSLNDNETLVHCNLTKKEARVAGVALIAASEEA